MTAWSIQYWDGSTWITLAGAVDKIIQELNGHEEATFKIANNETNRNIVAADRKVKILFDTTLQFKGLLSAPQYGLATINCLCYNECYVKMNSKDFTNTYNAVAANTILADICTAAGVIAGSCPTTAVSVRFRRAICWDAATFLAKAVNKDFWTDEDASGNPRFNIGDRGSSKGSVTPISWPDRGIDRSKKRDKVIIRGVDSDGNEIEGSAGTGTNIAVFTEKKASDVATLNNIAAQKLAELNKDSSGVKLPVVISVAYNLFPGDTVTLNNPTLNLVGDFRIWKITKYVTKADVEVDRPQNVTEKDIQATEALEDLGIYQVASEQIPDKYFDKTTDDIADVTDVTPAVPSITCVAQEVDTATEFRTWIQVTITRVADAGGYVVSYKKTADSQWTHFYVEQPSSGNPIATTPDLAANTSYDVHACSVSQKGMASAWCTTQTLSTTTNGVAPNAPASVSATPAIDGLIIECSVVSATDFSHYEFYVGTTTPPTTVAGTSTRPIIFWKAPSYSAYYVGVKAVDIAGNKSAQTNSASAYTPLQVHPIDLTIESRPWTADFKMWEDATTYGKLYWSAKDGASDITVKFADGSTKTINKNLTGTQFTAGLRFFYWDSTSTLQNTTDYGTAVGEGKGLICVVDVRTDRTSTILPFDSYSPTIGAGCIAAKSILTDHIKAGQITTNIVASDAALAIKASQIVLDGTTYFVNSWQKSGDVTKIDGGKISTGTILADSIAAGQILISKLAQESLDRMYDSAALSDAIQGWPHASDITKIDGGDIYTGSVHTAQILFDILNSDPTYAAGKLWYRGDQDQLRFSKGTMLSDVAIIPKYPLFDIQAPPENLVPNQSFEIDRDGDGIPDYFDHGVEAGSPSFGLSTAQQFKGKQSAYITCAGTGHKGYFRTVLIPVSGSKKYIGGLAYLGSVAGTPTSGVFTIVWRDKNQGYISEVSYWSDITTSWQQKFTDVLTSPSNARYAHIILRNNEFNGTIYFDDVVLSEMRAAVPTAGVVAAANNITGGSVSVPPYTWTTLVSTTIPDVDCECYFCEPVIYSEASDYQLNARVRIYDSTDGTYYPYSGTSDYDFCPRVRALGSSAFGPGCSCFITIPKNVKGHTLEVQIYSFHATANHYAAFVGWGHSPHTHR